MRLWAPIVGSGVAASCAVVWSSARYRPVAPPSASPRDAKVRLIPTAGEAIRSTHGTMGCRAESVVSRQSSVVSRWASAWPVSTRAERGMTVAVEQVHVAGAVVGGRCFLFIQDVMRGSSSGRMDAPAKTSSPHLLVATPRPATHLCAPLPSCPPFSIHLQLPPRPVAQASRAPVCLARCRRTREPCTRTPALLFHRN